MTDIEKMRKNIEALRGLADAAYGCGDWLAGASLLASARNAEAELAKLEEEKSNNDAIASKA